MRNALLAVGLTFAASIPFQAASFASFASGVPLGRSLGPTPPQAAQVWWVGQSGGFRIRWTSDDVLVESSTEKFQLFEPGVKKAFQEFEGKNVDENCTWERDFNLLSVVGPVISFSESHYIDCGGAHPEIEKRFAAVDLAKMSAFRHEAAVASSGGGDYKNGPATLTDYFPADVVLSSLLADPVIKKALTSPPANLNALSQAIGEDKLRIGECPYGLHADYLERFAFHELADGKVAVRLGLSSDYGGGCQGKIAQLGLLLAIPDRLKSALELAAGGKEGFLMRNQPKDKEKRVTRFQFETGKGSRFSK